MFFDPLKHKLSRTPRAARDLQAGGRSKETRPSLVANALSATLLSGPERFISTASDDGFSKCFLRRRFLPPPLKYSKDSRQEIRSQRRKDHGASERLARWRMSFGWRSSSDAVRPGGPNRRTHPWRAWKALANSAHCASNGGVRLAPWEALRGMTRGRFMHRSLFAASPERKKLKLQNEALAIELTKLVISQSKPAAGADYFRLSADFISVYRYILKQLK